MEFLNNKWFYVEEEAGYEKILICTTRAVFIHLGRYLDKVTYKRFNKIK